MEIAPSELPKSTESKDNLKATTLLCARDKCVCADQGI